MSRQNMGKGVKLAHILTNEGHNFVKMDNFLIKKVVNLGKVILV